MIMNSGSQLTGSIGNAGIKIKAMVVIPTEVGIQNSSGCRITSGMTKLVYHIAVFIATQTQGFAGKSKQICLAAPGKASDTAITFPLKDRFIKMVREKKKEA